MKIMRILFAFVITAVSFFSCSKDKDKVEFLYQVEGKIVNVLASVDENNQPKEFNWAISIN
jgi:hypothetical protein